MAFSSRSRTRLTLALTKQGRCAGKLGKVQFEAFRGIEGVILLIREGRRWRRYQTDTTWNALDLVERSLQTRLPAIVAEKEEALSRTTEFQTLFLSEGQDPTPALLNNNQLGAETT